MQTLRKKTSPLKYKNETTRFLGEGVSFKAKLIGILEVSEARGDRMCQEALSDLKMAIRAAGEHKQRITVNIALDGLRLRDEKTGDSLYHHPVHKISFIAQDMTDSRAFGYIFGSPDTGHRFFGIKTDKAASQVVIAMRDLFQVVFALKKKEIELAKQHLEKSYLPISLPYSEHCGAVSKTHDKSSRMEHKMTSSGTETKHSGTAVADLVDLELELNSLQQGLNQMERITPSDPFGSKDDPFGDSFISYQKLILPPPPSSTRERSNRTSDSSGISRSRTPPSAGAISTDSATDTFFSSKTNKELLFAHDFSNFPEDPGGSGSGSGDWFTPFTSNIFEETAPVPATTTTELTKDEKHEAIRQEIMSQFDVFTELDPLGTGRSKPYIDKKHFFQELKNPPKKALNELASSSTSTTQELFNINFNQSAAAAVTKPSASTETTAVPIYSNTINAISSSDPFDDDPFVKEDPFADTDFSKQDPFEMDFVTQQLGKDSQNNLSKTPKPVNTLDSNVLLTTSSSSSSPKTFQDIDKIGSLSLAGFDNKKNNLSAIQLPELETSSNLETVPELPPRPLVTADEIQPPPLPPKKQNDMTVKPPPRPPIIDYNRYAFINKTKNEQKNLDLKNDVVLLSENPPIPAPQRKSKFESEIDKDTPPPERPKKYSQESNEDEGYLTPVSFSEKFKDILPPPEANVKNNENDNKTNETDQQQSAENNLNKSVEGLDMTLTELTLSGLNELASKLKIPPHKLSNMTLVQLTNYLSTFIKSQSMQGKSDNNENNFANFEANFDNVSSNITTVSNTDSTYDRYAVFRELQEEIKQTKIISEPQQIEDNEIEETTQKNITFESKPLVTNDMPNIVKEDKYAALREIVEISNKKETNENETENNADEMKSNDLINEDHENNVEDVNLINRQHSLLGSSEKDTISKDCLIEYVKENTISKEITPEKSPSVRSPLVKTPISAAEIIPTNRRTSGSLSDILSGSSPEIDNTGSNSDIPKKNLDPTIDSWAIFDPSTTPLEIKENVGIAQSEDGVSPWSSDSKEFGNKSPTQWKKGAKPQKKKSEPENWWPPDVRPADIEAHYYPPNRRFTDSYEEEYYEFYERPRRHHHKQNNENWQQEVQMTLALREGGHSYHSSSSRDASPWEEEPRRPRDDRVVYGKPNRGYYEKHRDIKHTDSWDEEDDDDYGYSQEYKARTYYQRRDSNDIIEGDRWSEYDADRRFRRRRDGSRERKDSNERWRCVEWEVDHQTGKFGRYSSRKANLPSDSFVDKRRDRYDEIYRSCRDSQDSPWEEDEYVNEVEQAYAQQQHYLAAKKNWKQRPSSASEMDRKSGEVKSRHHLGGSDGERDRRYKNTRRSRSRDSQLTEGPHRYKADTATLRNLHRSRPPKSIEADYPEIPSNKIIIDKNIMKDKKVVSTRKKPKEKEGVISGFPRKALARAKSLFSSDSQRTNDNFLNRDTENQFKFDNDYGYTQPDNFGGVNRSLKGTRQVEFEKKQVRIDKNLNGRRIESVQELKLSPRYQMNPESPFEDDFALVEKQTEHLEGNMISSIKEEPDFPEEFNNQFAFTLPELSNPSNGRKRLLSKNKLSGAVRNDVNLKKSESVNIFSTENDPFDDEFFSFQRDLTKDPNNDWREEFDDSENTKNN